MSVALPPTPTALSAEDVVARFGPIPLWRIRTTPYPATEEDVLRILDHEDRACELIDGILVEKDAAADSSLIGAYLLTMMNIFVLRRKIGFVLGEQGLLRLSVGRLRAPDVSFIRKDQTPDGSFPSTPVPDLYPTLAVEVLSPGNTAREMNEKLDDYFASGCELAWLVDPASKTVRVFASRGQERTLRIGDVLDGGAVLPGFSVPVGEIFGAVKLGG